MLEQLTPYRLADIVDTRIGCFEDKEDWFV
jgi:hypothetical protein